MVDGRWWSLAVGGRWWSLAVGGRWWLWQSMAGGGCGGRWPVVVDGGGRCLVVGAGSWLLLGGRWLFIVSRSRLDHHQSLREGGIHD